MTRFDREQLERDAAEADELLVKAVATLKAVIGRASIDNQAIGAVDFLIGKSRERLAKIRERAGSSEAA